MEANGTGKDIEETWKSIKMLIEAGDKLSPESKIALELIMKNEINQTLSDVGKVTIQNNNVNPETQVKNLLEQLKNTQNERDALQDKVDDLKKDVELNRHRDDPRLDHAKEVYSDFAKTGIISNGSVQFCPRCLNRYGKRVRAVIGFDITTPPSSDSTIFWATFRHLRKNAKTYRHYIAIKRYARGTDRELIKNEMLANGTLSHVFDVGGRKKKLKFIDEETYEDQETGLIEIGDCKYTKEELIELEKEEGWETGPNAKPTRYVRKQKAEELNQSEPVVEEEEEKHDPQAEKIRKNLDAFFRTH